jgi:hypothetical protein
MHHLIFIPRYSWFGWVMAVEERNIEVEFLHHSMLVDKGSSFKLPRFLAPEQSGAPADPGKEVAPELLLVDKFWWLPTMAIHLALLFGADCSYRTTFLFFTTPSLTIPLIILLFNVMFHPPTATPTASGCYGLDNLMDPLSVLLGEARHEDHHVFPDRARRPGMFDLSYSAIIVPLVCLGVVWDPKHYATEKASKRSGGSGTTKAKPKAA